MSVIPHWFDILSSWAWTWTNWPRLNLAHAYFDIHGLKYMDINTVYSAPPSTLLPPLTKGKILQPEFQYAYVLVGLNHCQPWVNPMHCGLCSSDKVRQAGCCALWWMLYMYYIRGCWIPAYLQSDWKFSAIHDCSADMPQTNKWGEVEAQCLIQIGKRKKNVGLKIKLSERRELCVYFFLYKSKYSTINIEFSYLNFKNFHPQVQNNVTNCVQHKQKKNKTKNRQTKMRGNMILSIPGSGTMGTGMGKMPWV